MQPEQNKPIPEPALPPVPPAPFTLPNSVSNPTAPAADTTTPQMADDGDLIEKEWVEKLKQVISSTTQDPYQQSKKLTQIKADYLQKRYGKTLKAEE